MERDLEFTIIPFLQSPKLASDGVLRMTNELCHQSTFNFNSAGPRICYPHPPVHHIVNVIVEVKAL